jgi:hypothetical protein
MVCAPFCARKKKEDDGVPPPVQSERAVGVADKRCGQRTATTQFA